MRGRRDAARIYAIPGLRCMCRSRVSRLIVGLWELEILEHAKTDIGKQRNQGK